MIKILDQEHFSIFFFFDILLAAKATMLVDISAGKSSCVADLIFPKAWDRASAGQRKSLEYEINSSLRCYL